MQHVFVAAQGHPCRDCLWCPAVLHKCIVTQVLPQPELQTCSRWQNAPAHELADIKSRWTSAMAATDSMVASVLKLAAASSVAFKVQRFSSMSKHVPSMSWCCTQKQACDVLLPCWLSCYGVAVSKTATVVRDCDSVHDCRKCTSCAGISKVRCSHLFKTCGQCSSCNKSWRLAAR